MAKENNFNEIVQTLQEAQKNKEQLTVLASSIEKYIAQQKKGLEELEALFEQAREGKIKVKKRGGYRGRKSKTEGGGEGNNESNNG